ncbi:ATP-binding cassette domain-containing protein [Streptomyces sp. B6B3]|uniref:ATP-binding cassette domain-containing protein n=1 Tax=Streptomyces sp. B6B3 TaxID=3153570 RepID=UPI00325C82C1
MSSIALDDAAIVADGLRKTYTGPPGEIPAVQGVDLQVERGEFFGLLGPNGAGKSTTIGMLTTLVRPTAGRARVCGIDVASDPVGVKRRIGMVAQRDTLDVELTVEENLEFRGRYFGMGRRAARHRAGQLLEFFSLGERRRARPFELSGGQSKRVVIGRALMHRPDVLFLDEPTAALDPQTRINLWDLLRGLQAEGQTILLTTHHMEEAESLCDRVAVIDHGTLLACDTVKSLQASAGAESVVTVTYEGGPLAVEELAGRPGVARVESAAGQVRVFAHEPEGVLGRLVALAHSAGATVTDITHLRPSLETVFLALTGREYRE